MIEEKLKKIENLINGGKIDRAEADLKNLGKKYSKNANFLFLRGKIFYLKKLYYIAIDTFLIALEFEEINEIYLLLSKIYKELGNEALSIKLANPYQRNSAVNSLKDSMSGIYRIKS